MSGSTLEKLGGQKSRKKSSLHGNGKSIRENNPNIDAATSFRNIRIQIQTLKSTQNFSHFIVDLLKKLQQEFSKK